MTSTWLPDQRLAPTLAQRGDLGLAPDEGVSGAAWAAWKQLVSRRPPSRARHGSASARQSGARRDPGSRRICNRRCPAADDDRVRLGDALHATR
jgi:hypothetical protein